MHGYLDFSLGPHALGAHDDNLLLGIQALLDNGQVLDQLADFHLAVFHLIERLAVLIFLAGGVWELLDLQWPLIPILLILLGVYLLQKAVRTATPTP